MHKSWDLILEDSHCQLRLLVTPVFRSRGKEHEGVSEGHVQIDYLSCFSFKLTLLRYISFIWLLNACVWERMFGRKKHVY